MAKIQVDGAFIEACEGDLLIDVLLKNDINIPHFCYHEALGKDGNCRMCMVEIEGQKRPQIACDTPVCDGQIIRTKGENIEKVKRSILELELINHPIDCPICDQAGECKLQDYYMDVGLYDSRLDTPKQKGKKHVNLGSNVMLDQERCVLCTRCVRFTKHITKTHELGVLQRADHSVISTFPGRKLDNAYAMNVVDLCPVGALTSEDFRFHKRVWFLQSDEIICHGCAKGCSMYCDHHKEKYGEDEIYRYRPRYNKYVNGYFICDNGRLFYKKQNENRKFDNLIGKELKDFDEGISQIKGILKNVTQKKVFVISPDLSIEEMFVLDLMATHFNSRLVVSTLDFMDESFGDDFLKKSDLAINRNGALTLGLHVSDEEPKEILKKSDLAIFVDLVNVDKWLEAATDLKIQTGVISPFLHKDSSPIFSLACASHTEKIGTYLTGDKILQENHGKIVKNRQANGIVKICSLLADLPYDSVDSIRKSGRLKEFEEFRKGEDE